MLDARLNLICFSLSTPLSRLPIRRLAKHTGQFGNVRFVLYDDLFVIVDTDFGGFEDVLDQILPVHL